MRCFRIGNSQLYSLILEKNYLKFFFYIFISIIELIFISLFLIFGLLFYFLGYKKIFFWKIKNFMKRLGTLMAVLGYKYQEYR